MNTQEFDITLLSKTDNHAIMEFDTLTPEEMRRLHDHCLAIAQILRKPLRMQPLPTRAHQREMVERAAR